MRLQLRLPLCPYALPSAYGQPDVVRVAKTISLPLTSTDQTVTNQETAFKTNLSSN